MMKVYARDVNKRFDEGYFEGREDWKWKYEDIGWRDKAVTIKRVFNPNRVLDLGCAKGYLVRHLLDLDIASIGLDISKYAIHSKESENLLVADAMKLPFKNGSFDFVHATDIIEHLPTPQYMVKECYRVLTENGILYLETPLPSPQKGDITHINVHSYRHWKGLLLKNGFSVKDYVITTGRYLKFLNYSQFEGPLRSILGRLLRKRKSRFLCEKK